MNLIINLLSFIVIGSARSPNISGGYTNCIQVNCKTVSSTSYTNRYNTNTIFSYLNHGVFNYEIEYNFNISYNTSNDYKVTVTSMFFNPISVSYYDENNFYITDDSPNINGSMAFNFINGSLSFTNLYDLQNYYIYCSIFEDDELFVSPVLRVYDNGSFTNVAALSGLSYVRFYDFKPNISGMTYANSYNTYSDEYYGFNEFSISNVLNRAFNNNNYYDGYDAGYDYGYNIGTSDGFTDGYNEGFNDGYDSNSTAITIFSGIIAVGMIPINFFLSIFNFEILGINFTAFVSSLLSVAVVLIVIKRVLSTKDD